jgi:hypothetical protein
MSRLFTRLRVESHPLITGDNPPPFHWSLPGEAVGNRRLYLRRLRVFLQVLACGPDHRPNTDTGPMLDAVVSTGEPLSVIPRHYRHLYDFERRIIWTEPRHVYSPTNPPPHLPGIAGYPGPDGSNRWYFRDRHSFELGVIWAIAYDSDNPTNCLAPRPMVARFLTEASPDIPEPVVGLQWSIIANRRVTRESTGNETAAPFHPEEWWLREVS